MTAAAHESIGNQLRARREALGFTRAQLAPLTNCAASTIKLFEAGFTPKNSPTLRRIEHVLELYEAALNVEAPEVAASDAPETTTDGNGVGASEER